MAVATNVQRYTVATPPIKVEFIKCTMNASLDTVDSNLVRVLLAYAFSESADTNSIKGTVLTNGKTIRVTGDAVTSLQPVILVLVGF